MSAKQRLTSAVVASEYFQKHQQKKERERHSRYSECDDYESHKHHRQPDQRSDKQHRRGHLHDRKTKEIKEDSDGEEKKKRRGWQSERMDRVSVFDRLSSGFIKNQQREDRQVIELVETDPCDVPRGKRYFEHDDRGADRGRMYGKPINNRIPRTSLQRQRSRSPVWKHDQFEDFERQERVIAKRRRSRSSPVWKHDKFEEHEMVDNEKDTRDKEKT